MEKIVNELKLLKVKRDRKELQKEDSLRIEYLFNQYQKLKKVAPEAIYLKIKNK
jgi:hypothetical protein